jgi:hypothetical protein
MGSHKLSQQDAEHIRALAALTPITRRQLAEDYKVSKEVIGLIIRYKTYLPDHMKEISEVRLCRKKLHDMNQPGAVNTDGICRLCLNARVVQQRKNNPDKYGRSSTISNRRKNAIKGIDIRERKVGPCEICDKWCDPLHLDHCHDTGQFRGWLCLVCNTRLGILQLTEWVAKGQAYLDRTSKLP